VAYKKDETYLLVLGLVPTKSPDLIIQRRGAILHKNMAVIHTTVKTSRNTKPFFPPLNPVIPGSNRRTK